MFEAGRRGGTGFRHPNAIWQAGSFPPAFCFIRICRSDRNIGRIFQPRFVQEEFSNVDRQPARTQTAQPEDVQERFAGIGELPATSRRLHARLHDDAEEAELGAA